jgi:hypothetical protein
VGRTLKPGAASGCGPLRRHPAAAVGEHSLPAPRLHPASPEKLTVLLKALKAPRLSEGNRGAPPWLGIPGKQRGADDNQLVQDHPDYFGKPYWPDAKGEITAKQYADAVQRAVDRSADRTFVTPSPSDQARRGSGRQTLVPFPRPEHRQRALRGSYAPSFTACR